MKTMNVGAIGGDYEDQDLQRQIAMAQALRAKSLETPGEMVGGWYVGKNPLLNLGEAAIGHINERGAVGRQGEIQQGRDTARQELLGAMPTPTMEQELSGPPTEAGVGPGVATVQKPYEQQAQDWNQWSAKAAALRGDPMAQQLAMSGLTQAMSMPEKKLAAETRTEEARQARLEKALAAKEAAEIRAAEERERDRRRAEDRKDIVRLAASLRPAPAAGAAGAPALGKTQFKGFSPEGEQVIFSPTTSKNYVIGADGTTKPYTGKIESQASVSKDIVKEKEAGKNLAEIESIEGMVKANPKAFSLAAGAASTMLPNIIGARAQSKLLTDEERQTRAAVLNKASRVIHELYGAALTRGEDVRAAPWAPKPDDDVETTLNKMAAAKEYTKQRVGKPAAADGGEEWVRGPGGTLVRK